MKLGAQLPDVPQFDPSKAEAFPWQADLEAFIQELEEKKAKREADAAAKAASGGGSGDQADDDGDDDGEG